MKSEEFILQELEKEKQEKLAAEEAQSGIVESEKPSIKFMISGEAPVLMSKACELLIKDLSFRAWRHTERNRRRTLQRQDLHAAVGESEVYDFLIDIVPRVTTTPKPHQGVPQTVPPPPPPEGMVAAAMASVSIPHGMQVPNVGLLAGLSSSREQHHQAPLQYQDHDPRIQQGAASAGQSQLPQQIPLQHHHTTYMTMPQDVGAAGATGVPTYLSPSSATTAQHAPGTSTHWGTVPQPIDGEHGRGTAT